MANVLLQFLIQVQPLILLTMDYQLKIVMYIGVEDVTLEWFKSYLENRYYHVVIYETKSMSELLQRGLLQRSDLGLILFSTYDFSWVLKHHRVTFKMFADDTRFYFTMNYAEDTLNNNIKWSTQDLKG